MTWAARAAGTAERLVQHFGQGLTAVVRLQHTLLDISAGGILTELELDGQHTSGSELLTLRATAMEGAIVPGVQIEIAGDATTYEVTGRVSAEGNRLTDVPITPILAATAPDLAAVTITRAWGEVSFPCALTRFLDRDRDGELVKGEDRLAVLSVVDVPDALDHLDRSADVTIGGVRYPIRRVLPVAPGGDPAAVRLHIGSTRSS